MYAFCIIEALKKVNLDKRGNSGQCIIFGGAILDSSSFWDGGLKLSGKVYWHIRNAPRRLNLVYTELEKTGFWWGNFGHSNF